MMYRHVYRSNDVVGCDSLVDLVLSYEVLVIVSTFFQQNLVDYPVKWYDSMLLSITR